MTSQGKEISSDSELEQNLSNQALNEFKSSRFDECLILLKRLLDLKPNDARILLNKTVAEYYQSNFCKTDELRKQILTVKKQVTNSKLVFLNFLCICPTWDY